MNRINEIDNTIEGKEAKTYYQDHPELVVLSGRLYGKVTYTEYFDAYYLQFGDNVYYFPQKDSYQEGRNWKKKKFDSYEECLNFSQQHNIKIVIKSTVKSPFSNGLPDSRFLFPKRNTPYDPSERTDVSRIRENKHNTNMNKKLIRLTEQDLHKIVKESVNRVLKEARKNRPLQDYADEITRRWNNAKWGSDEKDDLWDEYQDLDRMKRVHQLRNGEFPTASYQGESYTIDDPLPNVPIYVHYTGAPYAYNVYPSNGESLRDYIEGRGESMEDITDWWIGE